MRLIYRSILHRIAAVILIATSLYHIYYIVFTERGRQLVKDLFPKRQDLWMQSELLNLILEYLK